MDKREFLRKLIESYISYDTSAFVTAENEKTDEVSDNEQAEQVDIITLES